MRVTTGRSNRKSNRGSFDSAEVRFAQDDRFVEMRWAWELVILSIAEKVVDLPA
jgi:hypothetical protein